MNALVPVVVRFLQQDGGQLSWTEDGEVSLSCDRPEPLSFHEFAGPLVYADLIRLAQTILDYRDVLESNNDEAAPATRSMCGSTGDGMITSSDVASSPCFSERAANDGARTDAGSSSSRTGPNRPACGLAWRN